MSDEPTMADITRALLLKEARDAEEVQTFFKEQKDEGEKHPRNCPCKPCLGRRSRRKGKDKQNAARKRLGVPKTRNASQSSNEENWRHYFRVEVKAGAQVGPVATKFLAMEKQADQNKAQGDPRPFLGVAMPDGWGNEGIVLVRLSDWERHVGPALDAL